MELKQGYKQTEVGIVPEEWQVSTVGREFDVKLGKMLDAEKNVGELKPYIGNRNVQWDAIDVGELPLMRMSRSDMDRFRLRKGDLLACEGGEVGRAAIWEAPIEECYYQKALHRLRPLRGFDSRLMVGLLRLWSDRGTLFNYVTQTSIAHLPREKFVDVPMPVPPSHEQSAISTALSDVDALLSGLDKLIAKKRDLRQAAMQQLLTGKTRLPGFGGEKSTKQTGVGVIPVDWMARTLGEIGESLIGLTYDLSQVREFGTLVLRSSNIQCDALAFDDNVYVDTNVPERIMVRAGDVLICVRNGSRDLIGKSAFLDDRVEGMTFGAFMAVHRGPYGRWVSFLLQSDILKRQINEHLGATINQITNKSLNSFHVPLPSDEREQSAIVEVLSDMDAELTALEVRREKTRLLKQGMMQELLTGKTRLV